MPKAKPRDEYDTQITQANKSLYALSSACFTRAGDCDGAWKAFQKHYPPETLAKIDDPATKKNVMVSGFESLNQKCKGTIK